MPSTTPTFVTHYHLEGRAPFLVGRFGLPDPPWEPAHQDWRTWPAVAFIEVQLWSDDPIRSHLADGSVPP